MKTKRKRVRLLADMDARTLELVPNAPKACRLHGVSTHPGRVPIRVHQKQPQTTAVAATYYMHPEFKLPDDVTTLESHTDALDVRLWRWSGDESMFPFWAIERLSSTELRRRQIKDGPRLRFSVEHIENDIMVLTVGNVEGKEVAVTYAATVPVVTNAVAVTKGEDLVMEVAATNPMKIRNDIGWKEHATQAKRFHMRSSTRRVLRCRLPQLRHRVRAYV